MGKTTFFRQHFEPSGYLHVNQDTLKTRDKCVKAVEDALTVDKKCVVVDNTNPNAFTRRFYIDLAKKLGVPVRFVLYFRRSAAAYRSVTDACCSLGLWSLRGTTTCTGRTGARRPSSRAKFVEFK